jgi:hypothetical protein
MKKEIMNKHICPSIYRPEQIAYINIHKINTVRTKKDTNDGFELLEIGKNKI